MLRFLAIETDPETNLKSVVDMWEFDLEETDKLVKKITKDMQAVYPDLAIVIRNTKGN